MKHGTKTFALLLAALALSLGLAACGSGGDGETTAAAGGGEAEGGGTVSGSFEPVAGVPAPYGDLSGEAELTRGGGETTVAIGLEGLVAKTRYTAHLHTGGCGGRDPGGPHFKFDPAGGDQPPNEIHLAFTTDGEGNGKAEVTADGEVPAGEAGSIVVHTAGDAMTASVSRFASLLVHEEGEHSEGGDDHGSEGGHDHGSGEPGSDGGGIQPLDAKVACAELEGGSTETSGSTGPVPQIEVVGGEPVDGIQELEYSAGEQIRFQVTADEAEEIHVHGYDLMEEIPQGGGTVEFDFPAEIEGIFEVELEGQAVQIAELRVNP